MTGQRYTITRQDAENAGKWLFSGALRELSRLFLLGLSLALVALVAIDIAGRALGAGPADDTDAAWGEHSGLRPRRDALTGCEYLETSSGGITPRLDRSGRQVCR